MPRKDPIARREYNREYQRIWYRKNRELHMQRVLRVTRRRREFAKNFVDAAKSRPCTDCGIQYEAVCVICHRLRTKLRREGGVVKPSEVVRFRGPKYVSVADVLMTVR